MAIRKANELENEIAQAQCSGAYLLFSDVFFRVKSFVKKIVSSVLEKEYLAFNFCEFDGDCNLQLDELQNCLTTVPLMASFRVVLIKNLCYFDISKLCLKKIEELVANLPKTSILIVTVSTENFDFKKNKKFRLWLDEFSKVAKVFDCGFFSSFSLFEFFSNWVVEHGSRISQANFNFLICRVSKNWQLVFNELEKLCACAYGREILKDDILNLTRADLNSSAFELANAILGFETGKALKLFKNLVELNVNLFLILGAINSCFADLYLVFLCAQKGLTNSEIIEAFGFRGCEFKIKNARKFVGRFELKKIKSCINILAELDLNLKTTTMNKEVLIEQAIVKMASRS